MVERNSHKRLYSLTTLKFCPKREADSILNSRLKKKIILKYSDGLRLGQKMFLVQ